MYNDFGKIDVVLASAVADDGTFTTGYPTGLAQKDFTGGLAGTGSYAVLNNNDKFTEASAGIAISYGASEITVTNQSGYSWPAGTEISMYYDQVDGNDVVWLDFPVKLSKVTAADVVTDFRPGVEGVIEYAQFTVTDPVTTGSKAATIGLEIGAVAVTGGAIALTSAAATPLGKVIANAADPSANRTLTKASTLSLVASSVTAFSEGEGVFSIRVRRTPTAPYI